MKRDEVLDSLFNDPSLKGENGFFLTSDNQAFAEKNKSDGVNHAKSLEEDGLDWCERPKVVIVEAVDVAVKQVSEVAPPAKSKKLVVEKAPAEPAMETPALEVAKDEPADAEAEKAE